MLLIYRIQRLYRYLIILESGSIGVLTGLVSNKIETGNQKAVAIFSIFFLVNNFVLICFHLVLYKQMIRSFNSGGLSIQKAKIEASGNRNSSKYQKFK